jgi:hypothetical protein
MHVAAVMTSHKAVQLLTGNLITSYLLKMHYRGGPSFLTCIILFLASGASIFSAFAPFLVESPFIDLQMYVYTVYKVWCRSEVRVMRYDGICRKTQVQEITQYETL